MKNKNDLIEALSHAFEVISKRDEIHVILSSELSRKDRELLIKEKWLHEIIKGWYLLTKPEVPKGDSSGWYATFWDFLYVYLFHFYGNNYCLSAEQSLSLHLGVTTIPKQVIVMASKGRGAPLNLPFNTSLLIYASLDKIPVERKIVKRLQVMSLPYALCKVSPTFFKYQPREAEIALKSIKDSSELIKVIVNNNFTRSASRLIGAYRFLKNEKMVNELIDAFRMINIKIQETNPFIHEIPLLLGSGFQSPYFSRIIAMWHDYRKEVIKYFSKPPKTPINVKNYLNDVDEKYIQDAYHSLSIEGYQVNKDLIEKVKNAKYMPKKNNEDKKQQDALAARGYYEAFLEVKKSLERILNKENPGEVIENDLAKWYLKLFAPCASAGIINKADLFGYRRHQVYMRHSRHTPLPPNALKDAMQALFSCLKKESHAGVRAVLGHFIFVFIHPYMDGNGRIGRLLMNAMLASGGYPWKIVHLEHRNQYLDSLEMASAENNIAPFAKFLRSE